MIQKLKLSLITMMSLLGFMAPLAVTGVAHAQITQEDVNQNLCNGANGQFVEGQNTECASSGTTANALVKTVINIISVIVGIVAVIMIIFAGFRYVTSGGKDDAVKGAKNTILYAVIGLVIVALAQIIVRFVLTKTTEATT